MRSRFYYKFFSLFQNYRKDTDGSILPLFAITLLLSIVIAGAGVDYSRAINNREQMAHALDAAALTVAAKLSTSVMTDAEINTALQDAFSANIKGMELESSAISNLNHTIDADNGVIEVWSTVSVPTHFMKLGGAGLETLDVGVKTEVNYSKFDVELALVLDVTGSMRRDIDTLQEASMDLLNTLIPEGTSSSDSKVRISVVPYSQGVNLGTYANAVTNGQAWNDCATERAGEAQYSDDAYNYIPDNSSLVSTTYFGAGTGNCPSGAELLPLTNKRQDIKDTIEDLDDGGGTAGQTGIQWGWYTLSPNWANLWPTASDPGTYEDDEILKFAIIMTDGDNNRYYDLDVEVCDWEYSYSHGWQYECGIDSGWSEIGEYEGYNNESSKRARKLCEAMQTSGITVYGIYFGSNSSAAGAKVMSDCASNDSTFYMATSSDDLINAFGNIAKKIQSIYLAK